MRTTAIAARAALVLALSILPAAAAEHWLHVKVVEGGPNAETVRVNTPLSLAEKVIPAIQSETFRDGKIKLDDDDLEGVDLRAIWEAVRTSDDAEYVTVESARGEQVRVSKSGEHMLIKADGGSGKREKVNVKVPLEVVDALFSCPRGELNIRAAVQALRSRGDSELVTVDSDDSSVRIWIDRKNDSR